MFCSNCGSEVTGNFCCKCGTKLGHTQSAVSSQLQDWSQEVRYEVLIRVPEVRDLVTKHASMAKKRMSGEEFLAFCDKIIPLGISLAKLGSVVQPIFGQLGVKTGKTVTETLAIPHGKVIVSALCSLARHGQALRRVQQFEGGCLLEATLPSDLWSWEGSIYVGIRRQDSGTRIEVATDIKGQLFDWGKSKRCIDELLNDLKAVPA